MGDFLRDGSSLQPFAGSRQLLGCNSKGIGRRDQIGFVRAEEIEHRAQHRRITQATPQRIGRQAGKRQESVSAVLAFEQPAERTQRQCLRIGGG